MTTPSFAKARVLIAHRKLAIDIGSFIYYYHTPLLLQQIGRIYDVSNNKVLILNYYLTHRSGAAASNEVTCKGEILEWHDIATVADIVFVLLDDQRKGDTYTWFGRKDTFVGVSENDDTHTFPCDSPYFTLEQSVSRTIWDEVQTIRECFRHLLGSSGLSQGSANTRKQKISISTFKYVLRLVEGRAGVTVAAGKKSMICNELKSGLQAFSNKKACVSEVIQFSNTAGVHILTEILGALAVFGIRRRRPKLADQMRKLETNDGIHYLEEEEDKVSASFEYARGLRQLTVSVSYKHYLVRWLNGEPTNVPTAHLCDAIQYNKQAIVDGNISSNNNSSNNKSLIGASFEYGDGNQLTIVKAVNDEICVCYFKKNTDPDQILHDR